MPVSQPARMSCASWPMRCCADGPVRTLAGLSLVPEHRRGHGALYDAVKFMAGLISACGGGGRWPGWLYRGLPMAGWCWPPM